MSQITKNICRFCLTSLKENYEVIEESIGEVFDVLLLELDLSVSEQPILCLSCKDSIQSAYYFKTTYISLKERVSSFVMDCTKQGTNNVHLEGNESMNLENNAEYRVCRFCMKYLEKSYFTNLSKLKDKLGENFLQTFFNDIDLSTIQKFVVCEPCMKSLESYHNFAALCRDTEEKVRKYCEFQITDNIKQIDLSDLVNFLLGNIDNFNKIPLIKKEDASENEEYVNYDINNFLVKIEEMPNIADGSMKVEGNEIYTDLVKSEGDVKYDINLVKVEGQPIIKEERIQNNELFQTFIETEGDVCYGSNTLNKIDEEQDMRENDVVEDFSLENQESYPYLTQESDSGTNVYRCETCTFQTVHKWNIKRHILAHGSCPEESLHKCNMCSYQTKFKGNLNNHILTHKSCLEVIMHKCDKCTFETKHKLSLKRHLLSHKERIPELPKAYHCEVCSFKTRHKINIKPHMLTHKDSSEVVMYKCERCAFESKHKRALRKHMVIHKNCSEVSRYKCKTCTFQTTHKWNLKRHLQRYKNCSEAIANEDDFCANNM